MISSGHMTLALLVHVMMESKPRTAQNIVYEVRQRYAAFLAQNTRPSLLAIVSRRVVKHIK